GWGCPPPDAGRPRRMARPPASAPRAPPRPGRDAPAEGGQRSARASDVDASGEFLQVGAGAPPRSAGTSRRRHEDGTTELRTALTYVAPPSPAARRPAAGYGRRWPRTTCLSGRPDETIAVTLHPGGRVRNRPGAADAAGRSPAAHEHGDRTALRAHALSNRLRA